MKPTKRTTVWMTLFTLALTGCSVYILLDTFVIPRPAAQAALAASSQAVSQSESTPQETQEASQASITETSYSDDNIQITIETVRAYGTTIYVADIFIDDPANLKTALAQDTYGRNIKETTSEIASDNGAILAINGDFYGSRNAGYVIRNGILYRDTAANGGEALVIDTAGNFSIVNEGEVNAADLLAAGAQQVLSFGPALVVDGQVAVDEYDEVSKAKTSNPRTAIGQVGQGHYIFIVSDGRSDESKGLTLLELAQEMADHGVQTAYNLDGGGSSTMVFGGKVLNSPAGGRSSNSERQVSDIVYIS